MEARMLNCPRKFGLTFFIDCMVKLCVRAFQNCIIANISIRFAALSHPRQLAFKFQRSLQLAIDRFCHGLLNFLQLEFHSILLRILVWLSYLQLDFNRSCHWCAQLFTAWFQSLLLSDWLGILQLDIIRSWRNWVGLIFCSLLNFNRSCYWFGKVLCSSHSIDFATVCSVSCSWLDFNRSFYWYGSALCSSIAIEFVIALIQSPATAFQAILSLVDSVFCSLLSIDLVIGLLMKLVAACFQLILPFICSALCSLLSVDCVIGLARSNPCSLFSIDLVIGLLSYSQLDLSGSCYWIG